MKNWLSHWNTMRIIRFAMGLFIVFQGIELNNWLFIVLGVLFALLAVLNLSTCTSGSCRTNFSNKKS